MRPGAVKPKSRDIRHATQRAGARRLMRLDMIAALEVILRECSMQDSGARAWMREKIGAVEQPKPPTTTTYNVGGVPVSVTGAHVAMVVVPGTVPAPRHDDAAGE